MVWKYTIFWERSLKRFLVFVETSEPSSQFLDICLGDAPQRCLSHFSENTSIWKVLRNIFWTVTCRTNFLKESCLRSKNMRNDLWLWDYLTISSNNFPYLLLKRISLAVSWLHPNNFGVIPQKICLGNICWNIRSAGGNLRPKMVSINLSVVLTKKTVDNIFWRCLPVWLKNNLREISPERFLEENLEGPFWNMSFWRFLGDIKILQIVLVRVLGDTFQKTILKGMFWEVCPDMLLAKF